MLPSFRQIQADRDLARKRREERQRRQRAKAKRKSLLEKLEDRRLLAALTVTNENDSGEGSLRAAIETANSNNEADTITFAASVPSVALTADTIRLKRDFGQGRTYKTVIEGPGKIIVGDSQLLVEQYADVEFRNLDVTGATNIAVRNFGTTHITRSTFYNNGTAIQQSDGTTYVTLSTISGNTERGIGATDGDLVITDTTVTANPIGIGASASYFRMYNTIVAGNTLTVTYRPTLFVPSIT